MDSISDEAIQPTAVELAQAVAQLLSRYARHGHYDPRLDWDYRRSREALLDRLRGEPCLARHAAAAGALFPPSLERLDKFDRAMRANDAPRSRSGLRYFTPAAFTDYDRRRWWFHADGGVAKYAALQSRLLTSLARAGLPAFSGGPTVPPAIPETRVAPPPTVPPPWHELRRRACELRAQGETIKAIAAELGRSPRTIHTYLK